MKRSHAFGFEPGNLTIRISGFGSSDGSGYFWFHERDTTLEDEDGQDIVSVEVPHSELLALRDHLNVMFPAAGDTACDIPPPGWWCSRKRGHDGPCAAHSTQSPRASGSEVERGGE